MGGDNDGAAPRPRQAPREALVDGDRGVIGQQDVRGPVGQEERWHRRLHGDLVVEITPCSARPRRPTAASTMAAGSVAETFCGRRAIASNDCHAFYNRFHFRPIHY